METKERRQYIELLKNKLTNWPIWSTQESAQRQQQVELIEEGAYLYTLEIAEEDGYEKSFKDQLFAITYSSLINKIICNLEVKDDNLQLVEHITGADIEPEYDELGDEIDTSDVLKDNLLHIAKMTSEELCPNSNRKIREMLENRKKQVIKKSICTIYTCPKCKHNETTSEIKQLKALDEGTTQIIECQKCFYKWRLC